MFFKKKEERATLPDLPPMSTDDFALRRPERISSKDIELDLSPKLANLKDNLSDDLSDEKNSLPSFPDSPMNKGFSQSAIKDAVGGSELSGLPNLPEDEFDSSKEEDKGLRVIEPPVLYRSAKLMEVPRKIEVVNGDSIERDQDIFVKIEKFKNARKSLADAREKLVEIEDLLKRIRETKLREEQELSGWENEINLIKNKIKDVTDNIFDKVE